VTRNATKRVGWKYVIFGVLSAFAAIITTGIEGAWVRGWSNNLAMYIPVAISLVASCALVGGLLFLRGYLLESLWIESASSICICICVLIFLFEIQPIAAGNNDSGEVFLLVFLPAIWLSVFALFSFGKLKRLRTAR
jgi:hypothetical protein